VRAWGRLGYPRRALRLHEAATVIVERHGGAVPSSYDELVALPGVGSYTAAAVAAFAFGGRHAVLDTNVRRVLARLVTGQELPPASVTAAERRLAEELLPDDPARAATWAVAVMELGALVCTARDPRCSVCPVAAACSWRLAGSPAYEGPPRRVQTYAGTDRQVRGRLMDVLRDAPDDVPRARLNRAWDNDVQRERALAGLLADGLVEPAGPGRYRLPTGDLSAADPG
jgi:A/G-specific adenine glycosylase